MDFDDLQEENAYLRQIMNRADVGITVINSQEIFTFYNSIAEKIDGLKAKDVIGKHISEIYPYLGKENSTMIKVQKTQQPILEEFQTYETKTGKLVKIFFSTFPLIYNRQIIGACDVSRDITTMRELVDRNMKGDLYKKTECKEETLSNNIKYTFEDIITEDQKFLNLKHTAKRVSRTSSRILIYGETGTGKELLAQAIHNHSNKTAPFIAQNCSAFPSTLFESILFGTVKGSFTGAQDKPGLFELADGGTLLLDEINAMPLELQSKILRTLQEGTFRRVGDSKLRTVNVRTIACTNIDPVEAVRLKQLRNDLFYRLNVVSFKIPPLRERMSDIPILVEYFISHYNKKLNLQVMGVNSKVMSIFQNYSWPGNVRELQHCIEHAMNVVLDEWIDLKDLPTNIIDSLSINLYLQSQYNVIDFPKNQPLRDTLNILEKKIIIETLKKCNGNVSKASIVLDMPRQTLQYRLKILGISSI